MDVAKVNRVEVIDSNGRSYVKYFDKGKLTYSLQDGDSTLKLFIDNENQKVTVQGIKERGYPHIYNLAIEEQSNQGNLANKTLDIGLGKLEGGFEWGDSPQGNEFWELVFMGEFDEALKLL